MKPHRLTMTLLTVVGAGLIGCSTPAKIAPLSAAPGTVMRVSPLPRAAEQDQRGLDRLPPWQLSTNFVDRVIHGLPVERHLALFAGMDADALDAALDTQAKQMAFWINLYNGYTQYFLRADPTLYKTDRPSHFGSDQVDIAGYSVSLEDIEHGVLRRGATIYTLGHVRLLLIRSAFVKQFAANSVDWRLHFALNCGATSCPPVIPYTAERLHDQLDAMSAYYLDNVVTYEPAEDAVHVPKLMRWFSADFDGGSAAAKRAILRRYGLIADLSEPSVQYLDYDWSILVDNYAVYLPPGQTPPANAVR